MSATLRRDLRRQLPRLYDHARRDLRSRLEHYGEAEIASRFPQSCPYTLDQVLGDFWPTPGPLHQSMASRSREP